MRALLWIVTTLALVWCGYWFVGRRGVAGAAEAWFAEQAAGGMIAERAALSVSGFPNRFDLTVIEPRIGDPETGIVWQAPFVQAFTMSWKPWHIIAAFPNEQVIVIPDAEVTVRSSKMQASVVVTPGTALALDRTVAVADDLSVDAGQGWRIGAKSLRVATALDPSAPNSHQFGAEAEAIALDPALLAGLGLSALPATIARARLDGVARLTAPLDRFAAETQPRAAELRLREALLEWGDFRIDASGTIAADASGLAEGRIDIGIRNWRQLLPAAVAIGAITPEVAPTVERMLETLASQSGDTALLDLPLIFRSGRASLGPIPLGAAPRLN